MSNNVTPIRPGAIDAPTTKKPKPPRRRKGLSSRTPTAEQILAVVDKHQDSLLNLEQSLRCIKHYAAEHCDSIMGAIELVETELARISEALEPNQVAVEALCTRGREP
jgi:hypothetical protein